MTSQIIGDELQHSSSIRHMEYISQLTRFSEACGCYQDVFDRGLLLNHRFLVVS